MNDGKTKTLKSGYLIYSDQKYLINEALRRLKKNIVRQSLGDLNVVEIASPDEFSQLEQALSTVGFFDQKKVVILHEADKLRQQQIKKVFNYLDKPNPDITLVLVALNKNNTLFEQAKKSRYFYEYKSPKKGHLNQWVIDFFKKEGKATNFEVASYLVDLVGDNLNTLSNEIKKIALYAGQKEKVEADDIFAVCSSQTHETIFDLVDALGQKNLSMALWHLNNLFYTEKEEKIFHMIIRQFRLLLKTKGYEPEGMGLAQIAKALKLPPFIAAKYQKQAKHFSALILIQAHSVLLETEITNKTTPTPLKTALELAIVKILSSEEQHVS